MGYFNGTTGVDFIDFRMTAEPMVIYAGAGDDWVDGGRGDDGIYGGSGNDSIWGNGGNDVIFGDGGNDALMGGDGHDWLLGGVGHDRLYGDNGNDVMLGESGNDHLNGGSGDDSLNGGSGADWIIGDLGNDHLAGGGRDYAVDTFVFADFGFLIPFGHDVIADFENGVDKLDFTLSGIDNIWQIFASSYQSGTDTVINLGATGSITLRNFELHNLSFDDFNF